MSYFNSAGKINQLSASLASLTLDAKNPGNGLTPCMGDNTTDDTSAIQALINYCYNNDKTLYFPPGAYKVTNTIYLPFIVRIKGSNPLIRNEKTGNELPGCRINFTTANANLFVVSGFDANGNVVTQGSSNSVVFYMEDMGIVYNDTVWVGSSSPSSSSIFKNVAFNYASVINRCTFRAFDYFFNTCSFGMIARVSNCNFREFGVCAINAQIQDSYFTNNYFSGSSYANGGANAFDNSGTGGNFGMSSFTNNWFEFCNYCFKGTGIYNIVSNNAFDYVYRAVDGMGEGCLVTNNRITHSNKSACLPKFSRPSSNMSNDSIYINIRIDTINGVTITNNMAYNSDKLIQFDGSSFRDVQTYGNVNTLDANTAQTPENIVTVNLPTSGYMGASHGTGITIQELNNIQVTTLPTTSLFPGRRVYLSNTMVTLGSDYKWRDDSGNIFGYFSQTMVPLFNDSGWSKSGTTSVSADNKTLTVTTTSSWQDQVYNVNVTGGAFYKFYSLSPAHASDGTTNQLIELWWLDSSNNTISKDYPSNTSNYLDYTQAPSNAVKVAIHLRCQTSGLTYTWTGIYFIAFNATIEGKVVTSPSGYQYLITSDDSGNLISTRFIQ